MSDYHCLDIEFPNVDFNSHLPKIRIGEIEVSNVHHAHLYATRDEIELRIFYDDQTYFGDKLSHWAEKIDWKKFGSLIKVEVTQNHTNERLQKVDLSDARLCGISTGSNFYEGNKKYVIVKINTVKFYWDPNEERKNTAEFYLDEKGFRVVEPFYGVFTRKSLFKNDGKFEINRMNDSKDFYKLGKSSFRPEFNVYSKDNIKERTATIVKEPKIQFKYKNGVSDKEAIFYGDVVLMVASFYHHITIDYIFRAIHLPENTITTLLDIFEKCEEKREL